MNSSLGWNLVWTKGSILGVPDGQGENRKEIEVLKDLIWNDTCLYVLGSNISELKLNNLVPKMVPHPAWQGLKVMAEYSHNPAV